MSNNFGYESNGKVCKCGRHHGLGDWTPERRAAVYKRMNQMMPEYLKPEGKAYLADWEKHHGIVLYRMVVVGVNSGHYYKENKGQDIWGAEFIDAGSGASNPGAFDSFDYKDRADIHG